MSKVKFARRIEFLITETIAKENGCIKQTYKFWTTNKKYYKYAFDQRFCLRKKLEKIFNEHLLAGYKFLSRKEDETEVVFRYQDDGEVFYNIPAKTINCEFYLPPFNGCLYCTKCKKEGDFLYCTEKKKHYDSGGIKTCPVFQSIEEIIS